jgi:hypothetical protein
MSKRQPDIPLLGLEGFEGISRIAAGRPLYHFRSVHSFHFDQLEDEFGDPWSDVELGAAEEHCSERSGALFTRFHQKPFGKRRP